jgi:hypothetical protein
MASNILGYDVSRLRVLEYLELGLKTRDGGREVEVGRVHALSVRVDPIGNGSYMRSRVEKVADHVHLLELCVSDLFERLTNDAAQHAALGVSGEITNFVPLWIDGQGMRNRLVDDRYGVPRSLLFVASDQRGRKRLLPHVALGRLAGAISREITITANVFRVVEFGP